MERIRVDVAANQYLRNENLDNPGRIEPIDASYAGLLQRYRHSDAPSVRYAAQLSAKSPELTGNERAQLIAAAVTPDPSIAS